MIAHLLPQRAAIYRMGRQSDGMGGWSEDFAQVASGVRCRVRLNTNINAGAQEDANQPIVAPYADLYAERAADIRAFDRVVVAGSGYEVGAVAEQADGAYRQAKLTALPSWTPP